MKRMMRDALVDRLKAPIYETVGTLIDAGPWVTSDAPFVADAVLAALGLDDLDAAVERAARAIGEIHDSDCKYPGWEALDESDRDYLRGLVDAAIAALTATQPSADGISGDRSVEGGIPQATGPTDGTDVYRVGGTTPPSEKGEQADV